MAKYVKALDLMVCATQAYSQGKFELAAKLLKTAAAHPSMKVASSLIDSYNDKQLTQARLELAAKAKKKPAAKKKTRSSAWPFPVEASTGPDTLAATDLEDLGIEVETNDGLREVQEADALGDDFGGEDEPNLELEDIDTLDATADSDEDDEGEGEEVKEEEDVEQARFVRALHNSRAQKKAATAASRLKTK